MRTQVTSTIVLLLILIVSSETRLFHKGSNNETLLVGQVVESSGAPARNLMGALLSIDIFSNRTLHSSLKPIRTSTFPLNYSVALSKNDFQTESSHGFLIVGIIWQPTYVFEHHVKLLEQHIDTLNMPMKPIKLIMVRGEIIHEKNQSSHVLPANQVKLELIEDHAHSPIIDEADYTCSSKHYPCPFEYWLDTRRMKSHVSYRIEATISKDHLPARKSLQDHHHHHQTNVFVQTVRNEPKSFKVDNFENHEITEIINYKIIVKDVEKPAE